MYNDNRIWQCIKGYNGYEYSNDGLLRSMKNFNVNPMGKLLKRYHDKKGYYYMLSDNNNDRKKVYETEIMYIVQTDQNPILRRTYETDIGSRNRLVYRPKQKINLNNIVHPRFTIVDDGKINTKRKALIFY